MKKRPFRKTVFFSLKAMTNYFTVSFTKSLSFV